MKFLAWLALIGLVAAALYKIMSVARINIIRSGTLHQFDDSVPEVMVSCAHCGVYIPASEALHQDGLDFCSQEHLKEYRAG